MLQFTLREPKGDKTVHPMFLQALTHLLPRFNPKAPITDPSNQRIMRDHVDCLNRFFALNVSSGFISNKSCGADGSLPTPPIPFTSPWSPGATIAGTANSGANSGRQTNSADPSGESHSTEIHERDEDSNGSSHSNRYKYMLVSLNPAIHSNICLSVSKATSTNRWHDYADHYVNAVTGAYGYILPSRYTDQRIALMDGINRGRFQNVGRLRTSPKAGRFADNFLSRNGVVIADAIPFRSRKIPTFCFSRLYAHMKGCDNSDYKAYHDYLFNSLRRKLTWDGMIIVDGKASAEFFLDYIGRGAGLSHREDLDCQLTPVFPGNVNTKVTMGALAGNPVLVLHELFRAGPNACFNKHTEVDALVKQFITFRKRYGLP